MRNSALLAFAPRLRHPPQDRLDVVDGVIALPRHLVGAVPLLARHLGMCRADVVEIVFVHVRIERHSRLRQL